MKHHLIMPTEPCDLDVPGVEALCGRLVDHPYAVASFDLEDFLVEDVAFYASCPKCRKLAKEQRAAHPKTRFWLYILVDGQIARPRFSGSLIDDLEYGVEKVTKANG